MNYPRLILAGTNSGVGKTTLALGIMLALRKKGLRVQPFKVGPDYIDPTYHTQTTGNVCRNLDTWLLSREVILNLFEIQAKKADVSIIEGVMGLYDGFINDEKGSTAHLAKILASPVILIVDASSMSRSAAAVVLGYREFDRRINIAGIILNNIGSTRHYHYVKSAIEARTQIPVLGFLPKNLSLKLPERHLGLIPTDEKKLLNNFRGKLLNLVKKNIDLNRILKISRQAPSLPSFKKTVFKTNLARDRTTIAVAKDEAFNFYYQDNLELLQVYGAEIIFFSPLADKKLPPGIHGLYLGGGFPEVYAKDLAANKRMKESVKAAIKAGIPIYAECGGLIYLSKEVTDFEGKSYPLVGVLPFQCQMTKKLSLGYREILTLKPSLLFEKGQVLRGHEFHYSEIVEDGGYLKPYLIKNEGRKEGYLKDNLLVSYIHLHFASVPSLAQRFVKSCQNKKSFRKGNLKNEKD